MMRQDVRVGDDDRERVAHLLKGHFHAGRLDHEELEERTEAAYAAVTRADLDRLTRDLPFDPGVRMRRFRRAAQVAALRLHMGAFAMGNAWMWAAWGVLGAGEPWPLIPGGAWGAVLGYHWFDTKRSLKRDAERAELAPGAPTARLGRR